MTECSERERFALYMEILNGFRRARGVYAYGADARLCGNVVRALHEGTCWLKRENGRLTAAAFWYLTNAEGFAESLRQGQTDAAGTTHLFIADLFNVGGRRQLIELKAHLRRLYAGRVIAVGWRSHNERVKIWAVAVATV
jgi:hypothetical protein